MMEYILETHIWQPCYCFPLTDTVADMLGSDKVIVGPAGTSIPLQLRTDPRESVRTLSTRIEFVPFNGTIPKWIQEG